MMQDKISYEATMDGVEIFIPLGIARTNLEAIKQYVLKLRSDYPSKKIELWERTHRLVEL